MVASYNYLGHTLQMIFPVENVGHYLIKGIMFNCMSETTEASCPSNF